MRFHNQDTPNYAALSADETYDEKTLSLGSSGGVPTDADVVVILGPKGPFIPAKEIAALDAYVQRGGSLFVLFDVHGSPSLIPFLERYNIHLLDVVAVDPAKRLYAGEVITYRVSATAKTHPMLLSVNAPPIFFISPCR